MKKYTTPDFEIEIQQVTDVIMASEFAKDIFEDLDRDPFNSEIGSN